MTYEEKRELRLQISQLLADAGLNQQALKEMVEKEVQNKVGRAVEQVVEPMVNQFFSNRYIIGNCAERAIKEELKNRVINVTLCGLEDVTVVK